MLKKRFMMAVALLAVQLSAPVGAESLSELYMQRKCVCELDLMQSGPPRNRAAVREYDNVIKTTSAASVDKIKLALMISRASDTKFDAALKRPTVGTAVAFSGLLIQLQVIRNVTYCLVVPVRKNNLFHPHVVLVTALHAISFKPGDLVDVVGAIIGKGIPYVDSESERRNPAHVMAAGIFPQGEISKLWQAAIDKMRPG